MSEFRSLPAKPSLEFERKEAKALHRRLRASDPESLARARARHPTIESRQPERIKLADAQLVIAREYGFTSWPKLVNYFGDVERQQHAPQRYLRTESRDFLDGWVRTVLVEHRDRRVWTARTLASYVPRFYGMRVEDVFSQSVTEDDARLAVARQYGFPSWDEMLARTAVERRQYDTLGRMPWQRAGDAIRAGDLEALRRVVDSHPELLNPTRDDQMTGRTLVAAAVHHERQAGEAALRPIMQWLEARGLHVQDELNRQLCGRMGMKPEDVQWLLGRGADPNWVAANGVPVLEHALMLWWNAEAVDLLATRAKPRKALWIAAGLGDVDGVRRSLDTKGKPTRAARQLRPDFNAVRPSMWLSDPEPDDEEILVEAFLVAMLNGRTAVLECMTSRGFPLNSLRWETPLINLAVGNGWVPVVECLVRCGADLDLRGWRPQMSARELARDMFEGAPEEPARRRILEICGLDPEPILAELRARPVQPAVFTPHSQVAFDLASDDAYRRGQSDIRPENLLFGFMRNRMSNTLSYYTKWSGMDIDRFRADVEDRVLDADDRLHAPRVPMHPTAQAVIDAAVANATARRQQIAHEGHVLYALTRDEQSDVVAILRRYGGSVEKLTTELERMLAQH